MSEGQTLRPGDRLGPYEIIGLLGAGGMGEVWRARDPRLEREVALKVLPAEVASDPERLPRFEREAKALAALNHPHIVTIHSVEEADGVRFLTMERVEGETLDRLIPAGGMALEQFLDIAIPLADALAAAHAKGVLHRDLKPANVMVTAEGRVKILDFGLAKLAGEPSEDLTEAPTGTLEAMTRQGQVLGTVPYMSPEQVQGRGVDARSDLFSLGAVLYQMATGRRPFVGESSAEVVSGILRDEPLSATELRPELPRQLGRILRHCLAKSPERRFQSAMDIRNELEDLREELQQERQDARRSAAIARPGPAVSGTAPASAPSSTDMAGPSLATRDLAARPKNGLPVALLVGLPLALLLVGALWWLWGGASWDRRASHAEPAASERVFPLTAVAVLPFQNLSADPEHAYFAGGLHDELLTQLARVADLSLRGRTSVMEYAERTKPIRQIAEELRVGSLLEGTVQVVGGRLRVNVQLIDAVTDEHLWGQTYDRTLDDAFAIQSEVAQRVVTAVGSALASAEQQAITEVPTANPEAYRLYLQGREYHRRPGNVRQNFEIAQQLYERAIELDPEFALAHAALSEVHGMMHWLRYDTSPARIEAQRKAAEEAAGLAPELPQAHMAMGMWHYLGRRDWAAAMEQYQVAQRGLPNDARLAELIGYAHRRMGNWDAVEAAFERASELDPRAAQIFADLGGGYYRAARRYPDAVRALDRALALAPDLHWAAARRGWIYVQWQGELGTLRSALEAMPADADLGGWLGNAKAQHAELLLLERNAVGLLAHLESIDSEVLESQGFILSKSHYAAWAYQLSGDLAAAQRSFAAALERLDSVAPHLRDDWRLRAARGFALVGLGLREEALSEADRLQTSMIYREDAWEGTVLARDRAWILALTGEAEAALDEIERLLAGPSWLSVHTLRLDPRWDPIRDHPRFQELLVRYAEP